MSKREPWTVVLHYPMPLGCSTDDYPFYVALVEVPPAGNSYAAALAALKKARAEASKAWRKDLKEQGRDYDLPNPCEFRMVFCSQGHVDVTYFGFQAGFAE